MIIWQIFAHVVSAKNKRQAYEKAQDIGLFTGKRFFSKNRLALSSKLL